MALTFLIGVLSTLQNARAIAPPPSPRQPGTYSGAPGTLPPSPTFTRDVLPIFMARCGRCHNEESAVLYNWLNFGTAYNHRAQIVRRVWDSWKGSYYKEPMPVPGTPESIGMTPEERMEILRWFDSGAPRGFGPPPRSALSKAERIGSGRRLFYTVCVACHQPSGQGIPNRYPPLARSDFLNNQQQAIETVLHGRQGPIVVNGQRFNNSMPRFPLSDEDIADVLTFVYNAFGNAGPEVTPQQVAHARQHPSGPTNVQTPVAPEPKSEFE